mmetsp:Transcript_32757/g.83101  ORF Transcript_32757/g.83101 Transcript_32757/m.83101 type:complete len:264 (-) Transcript_32757:624-1415(-)
MLWLPTLGAPHLALHPACGLGPRLLAALAAGARLCALPRLPGCARRPWCRGRRGCSCCFGACRLCTTSVPGPACPCSLLPCTPALALTRVTTPLRSCAAMRLPGRASPLGLVNLAALRLLLAAATAMHLGLDCACCQLLAALGVVRSPSVAPLALAARPRTLRELWLWLRLCRAPLPPRFRVHLRIVRHPHLNVHRLPAVTLAHYTARASEHPGPAVLIGQARRRVVALHILFCCRSISHMDELEPFRLRLQLALLRPDVLEE